MIESALTFDCQGHALVGVVTEPESPGRVGVLVIVGGPQYRIGSHRQFVHLARSIADAGMVAMRFDARGMGDSEGPATGFEDIQLDIAAALDALAKRQPQLQSVVLWGLCGGASAALLYLRSSGDPRVAGLVLVNPWVRSEVTLARARVKHYYIQRLMQREFWVKLLSGGVAWRALIELAQQVAAAVRRNERQVLSDEDHGPLHDRMVRAWSAFRGRSLLVLSGNDYTAKEFIEATLADPRWGKVMALPEVTRVDVTDADHTFSAPAAGAELERSTLQWLAQVSAAG